MWTIWAKYLLSQALKSYPKCNKSPNLVTLVRIELVWVKISRAVCHNLRESLMRLTKDVIKIGLTKLKKK